MQGDLRNIQFSNKTFNNFIVYYKVLLLSVKVCEYAVEINESLIKQFAIPLSLPVAAFND